MTTSAMLMQEIETLPEEAATAKTTANGISIENAYGIFKGINTHFERDEEDRHFENLENVHYFVKVDR